VEGNETAAGVKGRFVLVPRTESGQVSRQSWVHELQRRKAMRVSSTFEDLDNFLNHHSVNMHTVDGQGVITWANETELKSLGYSPDEYIGKFIGDFHLDSEVVGDILGRLTRFETVNTYPARLKKKGGSIAYVMINSNVYKDKWQKL
jgi:PAS domain S-box-containing protein